MSEGEQRRPFIEPVEPDLREVTPFRMGRGTIFRTEDLLGVSRKATNQLKVYLRGGCSVQVGVAPWRWLDRHDFEGPEPPDGEISNAARAMKLIIRELSHHDTGAFFVAVQNHLFRVDEMTGVGVKTRRSLTPSIKVFYRDGTVQEAMLKPSDYDQSVDEFVEFLGSIAAKRRVHQKGDDEDLDIEWPGIDPMNDSW